jgi:hypothetical protein
MNFCRLTLPKPGFTVVVPYTCEENVKVQAVPSVACTKMRVISMPGWKFVTVADTATPPPVQAICWTLPLLRSKVGVIENGTTLTVCRSPLGNAPKVVEVVKAIPPLAEPAAGPVRYSPTAWFSFVPVTVRPLEQS